VFNDSNTPVVAHSTMATLLAVPDGSLWIGTTNNGLLRYRNGNFEKIGSAGCWWIRGACCGSAPTEASRGSKGAGAPPSLQVPGKPTCTFCWSTRRGLSGWAPTTGCTGSKAEWNEYSQPRTGCRTTRSGDWRGGAGARCGSARIPGG